MSWEKELELKIALDQARKITKAIKYDNTVGEIFVQIEMLAEKFPGIDMRDLNWKMDEVREAKNALESAVYGLEEPFEEALRNASFEYDEEDEEEDVRESGADNLFGMLSKQFEKEFGAPMSDPMAKRSEKPDRQRPEPRKDNDKEVKESFRSGILEGISSKDVEEGKQKGLWANIHAKRKRGEPPAKPGEKGYPKTLDIDEEKERLDPKCWKGYKKQGTKMKGGVKVNNCVPK